MSKTVIDSWSKFDIKAIQHELDEKVIEIAQQLEEGDQSRKKLIEQTKEFRKNLADEQRKLVAPILKSFQIEVDSSTKRTKTMEQVLLKIYKQLIELPDPAPLFESAQRLQKKAERAQDLELENKQLRETLDEYNAEFAEVKNQEVTIKMLKDRIKELEDRTELLVQQKVKERERELTRLFGEKEEQVHTAQLELAKKLGDTEARNQSLQSQVQKVQNELYDLKAKQDEIVNGKACEIDMLMQDLDKMSERAVSAERLLEQYSKAPAAKPTTTTSQSISELNEASTVAIASMANELDQQQQQLREIKNNYQTSTLEIELVAKEKEISQLVDDIHKLQLKANKDRQMFDNERAQLEERLAERERAVEKLQDELKLKRDYDEVKNELKVLKSIEFSSSSLDAAAALSDDDSAGPGVQKSLEILLLEKNRYLQNENTQVKNRLSEVQLRYDQVAADHRAAAKLNAEQKALIVELEKDLYQVARKPGHQSASLQLLSGEAATTTVLDLETLQPSSPLAGSSEADDLSGLTEGPGGPQDDGSLLKIVSSQRERFRARVQELETENLTSKQQVLFLTNELDRLRSDNLKLYEKIKFLQSNYTPGSGGAAKAKNSSSAADMDGLHGGDDDSSTVLNKYTNEYEQRLDPFSKFNYREKQKRYVNLKLHDKFTLNFGRFILSSKLARLIFCAYFFIIHLLIFISIYSMASSEASHRSVSADCARSFSAHMAEVHGDKAFSAPH